MALNNKSYDIHELAEKWANGSISGEERAYLEQWYADFAEEEVIISESEFEDKEALKQAMLDHILAHTANDLHKKTPVRWLYRIAAAASILLFLSIGGYFLLHKKPSSEQVAQNQQTDIAPGRNQATLTLANGQKIILSKSLNGKLAQQGNTSIIANAGRTIVYTEGVADRNATVQYNSVSTTRGEQSPLPLVLADGTKVWLNAASSITFPTAFNGKDRVVRITGEVCFAVRHNALQPFRVETKGQVIEDIGTVFNINAYDDEPVIRTTLSKGSVKVGNIKASVILKPGQQAIVTQENQSIKVSNADLDETFAWKDGMFRFTNESLESILRKVSRWYNVDIEYTDNSVKELPFGAVSTRFTNVSQVLKMLEMSKEVRFKVEGKKIIVMK